MPLTPSEQLVADLCRRSFLTLWSEPNPITRPGKELCDLIVVCDPHVLLFSVKEITFKDTGAPQTDWQRWRKKAVDESVKQLYGAERWLQTAPRVIRADGAPGLRLPQPSDRRVHRVAVALGGRGTVPYSQGDFGKGFVHVLEEEGLRTILQELDTITDFVSYLSAKEALVGRGAVPFMEGQEEDLLALYLHQGRTFPAEYDLIVVGDGLWRTLTAKPEWKRRNDADEESYVWDGLIETLRELADALDMTPVDALDALDGALGVMAREDRFARRILAQGFNEFMRDAARGRTRARVMPSPSGVRYVFLASGREEDRQDRRRELALRCFVARGMEGMMGDTVVGLATERYDPNGGFSFDVVRLTKPSWTEQDEEAMLGIQRDLGYFASPVMSRASGDEFPEDPSATVGQ